MSDLRPHNFSHQQPPGGREYRRPPPPTSQRRGGKVPSFRHHSHSPTRVRPLAQDGSIPFTRVHPENHISNDQTTTRYYQQHPIPSSSKQDYNVTHMPPSFYHPVNMPSATHRPDVLIPTQTPSGVHVDSRRSHNQSVHSITPPDDRNVYNRPFTGSLPQTPEREKQRFKQHRWHEGHPQSFTSNQRTSSIDRQRRRKRANSLQQTGASSSREIQGYRPQQGERAGIPLRVLFPDEWIGYIVGKGGKTINQISNQTKTTINVMKEHLTPNLMDKVVFIYGSNFDDQQAALTEMLKHLQVKARDSFISQDGKIELITLIPEKAISFLIGSKGQTINRIWGHSDKTLSVQSRDILWIASGLTDIHRVMAELYNKDKLNGPSQCGVNPFFALYEDFEIHTRLIMDDEMLGRRMVSKAPQKDTRGMLKSPIRKMSVNVARSGASKSIYPKAFVTIPHLLRNVINNQKDLISLKFLTTKAHAACIIGNGGSHKREIETLAGCSIKIQNAPPADVPHTPDDRLLIFKINPMAVAAAVHLCFIDVPQVESVRMVLLKEDTYLITGPTDQPLESLASESETRLRFISADENKEGPRILEISGAADCRVTAVMLVLQRLLEKHEMELTRELSPDRQKRRRESQERLQSSDRLDRSASPLSTRHVKKQYIDESNQRRTNDTQNKTFLEHVVTSTQPKTLMTTDQFALCLSFSPQIRQLVDALGPNGFNQIERVVSSRVGSSVTITRLSSYKSDFVSGQPQTANDLVEAQLIQESLKPVKDVATESPNCLHFLLIGTPLGNSTAVLTLHEVLMNLQSEERLNVGTHLTTSSHQQAIETAPTTIGSDNLDQEPHLKYNNGSPPTSSSDHERTKSPKQSHREEAGFSESVHADGNQLGSDNLSDEYARERMHDESMEDNTPKALMNMNGACDHEVDNNEFADVRDRLITLQDASMVLSDQSQQFKGESKDQD